MCSRTVSFDNIPLVLTCWKDSVAVGMTSGDIVILDAVTGSQTTVLSEHTCDVTSLAFSLDGTLLVSGDVEEGVGLWDVQTGGVVKTFYGHTEAVLSVSISLDCATVASGSYDRTICLWDVQTGDCLRTIEQHERVDCVSFSPTDSRHLISASGGVVRRWNIDGRQIGPTYNGHHVAFSSDGTRFVSCDAEAITIRNSDSGVVVAKFDAVGEFCFFSPDSRLVAVAGGNAVSIWDITDSDPHLIETPIEHTGIITSLTFSSSLISASDDRVVKFWQIGALLADPVTADPASIPLALAPTMSISLQTRDGIVISIDSVGMVRTWDISTGHCKASFQTPAEAVGRGDAQMIGSRLVIVWCEMGVDFLEGFEIHVWDTEKGGPPRTVDVPSCEPVGLVLSGDGSKFFLVDEGSVRAWSVRTGKAVGEASFQDQAYLDPLRMDGSRVSIRFSDLSTQGWDFGVPGSPPIPLPDTSSDRPPLDFIDGTGWENASPARVEDTVTGKEVFRLSGRYAKPFDARWDGRYLAACYEFGEVLILDFDHILPKGQPRKNPRAASRPKILFYHKHEPHYGFTNFSPHPVMYRGKRYPTSEHLFQSFKVGGRTLQYFHSLLSRESPPR